MVPPLGVVDVVYAGESSVRQRAVLARADGFVHIDVAVEVDPSTLVLPVGCPTAFPRPQPGWCSTPAPPQGEGAWERVRRWFRAAPGAVVEPWAGSVLDSAEACRALIAEVPGLRLLVDTGHVASWGGDPSELADVAAHVQLRQGAPGAAQLAPDDARGCVDFAAFLGRLDEVGYAGRVSVEHFDLPEHGWPCPDPRAWAVDLAARIGSTTRSP